MNMKLPIPSHKKQFFQPGGLWLADLGVGRPDSLFSRESVITGVWALWWVGFPEGVPAQVNTRKDNAVGKRVGPSLTPWTKT